MRVLVLSDIHSNLEALEACLDAAPELQEVAKVITLRESLGCWRLALWDERRKLLVGFRDVESQLG